MPKIKLKLKKFWGEFRRTLRVETKMTLGCVLVITTGIIIAVTSLFSNDQSEQVFGVIAGLAYTAIAVAFLWYVWCPEDDLPLTRARSG